MTAAAFALGLLLALGAGPGPLQEPGGADERPLGDVAEIYRSVDREKAVAVVALWDRERVETETQRLLAFQSSRPGLPERVSKLLAAAALLADSAQLDRDVGDPRRSTWELESALRLVGDVPSEPGADAFCRRLYLAAGLMLHGMANLGAAHDVLSRGVVRAGDDAELLAALGAISETIASLRHYEPPPEARGRVDRSGATHYVVEGQGGGGGPLPRTSLSEAQQSFAKALALDPGLVEARLRLGRVLLLRGRPGEALPELERVGREAKLPEQCYLARLFESRARELLGDLRGSASALEAGAGCAPQAQSGLVALGRALDRIGEATRAQQAFDQALRLDADTRLDPWWSYLQGDPQRVDAVLVELRRLVP